MTKPTTEPMEPGALARVITASGEGNRAGDTFMVEDYVSADEAEDGEAFYWGSSNVGYNDIWALASCVEQAVAPTEVAARTVPSPEEVASSLGLSLHADHGCFEVDESESNGDILSLYGSTAEGLRVAVRLRVISVMKVDF